MGRPFSHINVCPKCQKNLSKCGLTYFVAHLYSLEFKDSKLEKSIFECYGKNHKTSLLTRNQAFQSILDCGSGEVKRILIHAANKDSKLRETNYIGLKCLDIHKYANILLGERKWKKEH